MPVSSRPGPTAFVLAGGGTKGSFEVGALQYLISVVGPEHVMFGTDWPHQVHDTKGAFANTAALAQGHMRAIRGENAKRVFGF